VSENVLRISENSGTPHMVFATETLLHHEENSSEKDSAIMLVKKLPVNEIHEGLLISKWVLKLPENDPIGLLEGDDRFARSICRSDKINGR
jgi:hypothetical protein